MNEVQVKLDGESKPVTDVPVQPVQPVAVKPVQPVAPPPTTTSAAPPTETVESPLDDELPQRIEPIQSTGINSEAATAITLILKFCAGKRFLKSF